MAPRPLRGGRYLRPDSRVPDLAEVLTVHLPTWDMDETLAFYEAFRQMEPTASDYALLALNDLFFLLTGLCNRRDAIHPWLFDRCREVEAEPDNCLDLWARGHYKALHVLTPVLTPQGWRIHGDLQPGDQVYGPDGLPRNVVAQTKVFTDADCYRVQFDDGENIIASGDHLWTVDVSCKARINGSNTRVGTKTITINTRDLAAQVAHSRSKRTRVMPRIPVAAPVLGAHIDLPVDPYVLGAWLGDGTSTGNRITASFADADEMQDILGATGHSVTRRCHSNAVSLVIDVGVTGRKGSSPFTAAIRSMGLFDNKHIPERFFTASRDQRMAMLQGLMDTDGSCHKTHAQAIFCNASRRLAHDVLRLASSLGIKATLAERNGVYRGARRPFYQVQFRAHAGLPVFRLRRKASLASDATPQQTKYRRIVAVSRTESVPVSCIQVDHPDGLYLAGHHCVPTHNSSIITFAKTIQDILDDPELTVGIFSFSRATALKFVAQIQQELTQNENLKTCFPDVLYWQPDRESPRWSLEKGLVVKRQGNPKEATVEGHGLVEGMPTGVHFKMLVFDDMIEVRNVTNPEQIQKATEAWELSDNLGVGPGTRKRYVGTRYLIGDTYETMIDRKVVKVRLYPATHNGRIDGKPVYWDQATWEKKVKEQRSTAAAQLLQNPAAGKQAMFEASWFRFYEVRPTLLNIYIMMDPSRGRTVRSDRTAVAVVGIDGQGNKYLLDGARHRMKLSERWDMLLHLHRKWREAPGVQMVRVGYERFGQQSDDEYFQEKMQALRDPADQFAIDELAWPNEGRNSKADRVQRLQPDFEGGKFFLPPIIRHEEWGDCYWRYNETDFKVDYLPFQGHSRLMRAAEHNGQKYRIPKAITRLDENKDIYDLTKALMDEMIIFPFGSHDDLVDVTSRIYDMQPTPATLIERLSPDTHVYPDA
jgi:hypothetical protein